MTPPDETVRTCHVCGHQEHQRGRCDVAVGSTDVGGDLMCDCPCDRNEEHTRASSMQVRITIGASGYECPCGFQTTVRQTAIAHALTCPVAAKRVEHKP